ncbi:MAG: hypothetical protein KTR33_01305, partial [Gammaproteobacteria bacterium]|nr:hypothetical protein [Gammaproteobacteria bacterium]
MVKELASAVASGAKSLDVDVLVCPTAVHIADVA